MTDTQHTDRPSVGQRVVLSETFESFPLGSWPAGETGKVTISEEGLIGVALDRHYPELTEWENCLMWYGETGGQGNAEMVSEFWRQISAAGPVCLPEAGTEVVLTRDVERYPTGIWKAGERGTVVAVDHDSISVRLDVDYPELSEWDNCLMWYASGAGLTTEGMALEFQAQTEVVPHAPTP